MREAITHPAGTPNAVTLLREGWSLLVDQLGVRRATEFVVLLERGRGDTVEDIIQYWGDVSIDEIHSQVLSWKHRQSALPADRLEGHTRQGDIV